MKLVSIKELYYDARPTKSQERKLSQHHPRHCTSLYAFRVPQEHVDKSLLLTYLLHGAEPFLRS